MAYSSNMRRRMKMRREPRCSREDDDFIGFKSGPLLMHHHPYWYEYGNDVSRGWRDSSSSPFAVNGSRYSYPTWGFPSELHRHPGDGQQGEWHLYQRDYSRQYHPTPPSGDGFMNYECFRSSGCHGNSRYLGNYNRYKQPRSRSRDNKGNADVKYQRSVGNSPLCPYYPKPDPRLHSQSKDNSLGGIDLKPFNSSRLGSLTSKGSCGLMSIRGETYDVEHDLAPKNATPLQSPSGDILACAPSAVPADDLASRKKPRLGWGEGLAKYEEKKVETSEEEEENDLTTSENLASVGIVELVHPVTSNLVEMSPEIAGFSDCSSPARPPSFTCSSSPGLEEKTIGKTISCDSNNFSVSATQTEGMQFNLEKLELNLITNLSCLLDELLRLDGQFSTDSGLMGSSALSKLLLWKGEILMTLELTETEIDSLETELKLLHNGNSYQGIPCPDLSKTFPIGDENVHRDDPNAFARPLPLGVGSSEDMTVESALPSHYSGDNHPESKDVDISSPETATSKFSELLFARKPVSSRGCQCSCSSDSEFGNSSESMLENGYTCDNKRTVEGTHCQVNDLAIEDASVSVVEHTRVCDKREDNLCDVILASNKETSSTASEMLIKLLPGGNTGNSARGMEACLRSYLPPDITIKKKFWSRKRLLRFKERVISLKYRAFYHLWKEDLRLDSLRSHQLKSQKKLDVTSRTKLHMGKQKHWTTIHACCGSPAFSAGSLSSGLSTEILNLTKKLLSDSKMKNYRSSLKMPAMILDEKDKMSSRFMSSNRLVEDPCAVEKERELINPWTFEEKKIFMDKLTTHGKDFRIIASFLDHKTIADCIQFYYKNHKSKSFEKTKKLAVKKLVKPLYSDTYMLTSEKKWDRETKSASLDILGEVSVIAALTDQDMKTVKLTNKKRRRSDSVTEAATKSSEADLLSSEAMGSCITNSVGSSGGNHELKHHKVGLRPVVLLNVDDDEDTCSDEIRGERDFGYWTDEEKLLFVRAFLAHGRDFLTISGVVRSKTQDQCKVFFSKCRKCLGLENLIRGSCWGRLLGSKATNGSRSGIEGGTRVVETRRCDKSYSITERDLPHVSQSVNCGSGQLGCKETNMEPPEVLCPVDVSDIGLSGRVDGTTDLCTHVLSAMDPATNTESAVSCEVLDPNCTSSREPQCKQSTFLGCSNLGDCEGMIGLPVDLTAETKSNTNSFHKPGSRKVQPSQECHYRKCIGSSSDTCCSGSGGVKLLENILSKTPSLDKEISISWQYDKTMNHHLGTSCGIAGLENVPLSNYGIWDGSKIKVVSYPPLTKSSSPYQPVSSGKCNQNNTCQFSPREFNDVNVSFVD